MSGNADQDQPEDSGDQEAELLERLLEHFETGVSPLVIVEPVEGQLTLILWSEADSARTCVSACQLTSKFRRPDGRSMLRVQLND